MHVDVNAHTYESTLHCMIYLLQTDCDFHFDFVSIACYYTVTEG